MSNASLGLNNREIKSESGISFAIASQPLQCKTLKWWPECIYGSIMLKFFVIFCHVIFDNFFCLLFLNLELTKYSVGFRATPEQTLLSSEEKIILTIIFFNSDHYEDPQVQFNWDDDDSVYKQHRQSSQSHNGDDDNKDNSQSLPARQSECLCLQVSWSSLHSKNDHVH